MKKGKRERITSAVLGWAVLLATLGPACSTPHKRSNVGGPTTETRIVNDDLGRNVLLPPKIERAISLAPSLTEIIFAIGAGDRLVGVTTYCNYPPEAQAIQKVSDTQTPNIESILALRPDVVFVTTASQLEAFTHALQEQGISVYVTNPDSTGGVFESMVRLGGLFGRSEEAKAEVAQLSERLNKIEAHSAVPAEQRPRVFVQISNEPLFTIGRESFLTQVVAAAGGLSVTRDVATAYPKLSKETALALDPQVIVLSDSEDNRAPNAVFKNSPAVRNGRVYRINADIISRPGPRLVDAVEQLAGFLRVGVID